MVIIMSNLKDWNLVADIGGTNARFAMHDIDSDELKNITVLSVAEYSSFIVALQHAISLLTESGQWKSVPAAVCLAVACPVYQDLIRFTNSHWTFSKTELSASLGHIPLDVINDFSAIAYSITALKADEWFQLGGGKARTEKPIAILGPGTGLGMCTLVPVDRGFVVLDGEGGNSDFAPATPQEIAILQELSTRFRHVSIENLLSGKGIINIYQALCKLESTSIVHTTARDISTAAMQGTDDMAVETLSVFCRILGATAGNLAMITGAKGGVYIAGGIPPKIIDFIANSECRSRFEDKGRFTSYVAEIPLRVLLKKQPGLNGALQKIKLNQLRLS